MIDYTTADDTWVYTHIAEGADENALWKVFLDRFQKPCFRVIRRTLLRRMGPNSVDELADEMFQSFFMALLKNDRRLLTRYRGEGGCTPRTYLCYLAGYHVLTELRSRKNIPELYWNAFESTDDGERQDRWEDKGPGIEDVVASREALGVTMEALETLSEIDRRIFRLLYVDNLSIKEIAQVTGDSLTTLRVQHHRLRKRLKQFMEERGFLSNSEDRRVFGAPRL